ncbi:hypothetical protein A2957_02995 [Candidatus Roizmanbacteria bacterium RIFCSPLOWO2_01_FULL_38_11]|uniref:Elongation factor P n=1 Tax=Candidatus Roizmanbacteria bacterium RIFCSPLOWO2_01_FULL_38_11 TaxID=1802060 RepID=A0A1F7IK09_9BACT|nr:MAG: hypothetical protein A2957_02995 [Candidatus Roizmanbacteria bacterium RIFCSPLOWO2_01_FULL_38_11]
MKLKASGVSKGDFVDLNGQMFQIQKVEHNFRGRGSSNLRFYMKNVKSGGTIDKTFGPDNILEQLTVDTVQMQYLYKDSEHLTFMNEQTYEQFELPIEAAEPYVDYIKDGQSIYLLVHDGQAIAMRAPQTARLLVTDAEDAVKGNTAMTAKKLVTVETGAKVYVPLFIKKGDMVAINPETGDYIERVN